MLIMRKTTLTKGIFNMKTSATKKVISIIATGMLCATGAIALTGCDSIQSTITQATGQSSGSTHNTKVADRSDTYSIVEDIQGNKYATVIYMEAIDSKKFDPEVAKQVLTQANINWFQMTTSDAMGTDRQEYGMVYFPKSVTLTDMQNALNYISGVYNAHIMTEAEYQKYLDESPTDNVWDIQIYGKETTHCGPAYPTTK